MVRTAILSSFVALFAFAMPVQAGEPVASADFMVSTANPLATQAARDMIMKGGSAVDATIAAQLVLTLTEPQSSGIGGGAFMLHFDAGNGAIVSYDGRETAPASATSDLFQHPDGTVMGWLEAAEGGISVGVPGVLRMLEMAHAEHGKLAWADLFEPAIDLAENGFQISPRLYEVLDWVEGPERFPAFYQLYFDDNGERKAVGTRLTNPALAASLHALAEGGADALYQGTLALEISEAVAGTSVNPAVMTLEDIARYEAVERPAVCVDYRIWTVCGMGPPSSGGVTVAQILLLLEGFDMASVEPGSLEAVHLISEAERLAYADRNLYLADSDFVDVPVEALIDEDYLAGRATLIDPDASMGEAFPGVIEGWDDAVYAPNAGDHGYSTSHISIVDREGNAVSMTTSIERGFGSRLMAGGFMLNNELTDFSFEAEVDGIAVANRVEPGKRPRSSMAPSIVFNRDGNLVMAVGTVGGSRIITYVAKTLIAALDWQLDIQAAIELPHHVNRNGPTELEDGTALLDHVEALEALGHEVKTRNHTTGLAGFYIEDGVIYGGADPRREGTAVGN
ncbi:MAG: gamma-glutamyltransferase [Alphaproteobacteria bacterium]|nr:gamma-glutamyltransferase [Rhodospirillaceae bacterium]MBT6509078.1 gamma-glutamyltransferase [Rhodospirillaceae bacterium]MBT7613944.1 gamma-glutamyltransferase [Rhodospirillaceae bacterium]MDG2479271.1 gamma-glutamyltransferase [Alphaproteobacteria bacterium]